MRKTILTCLSILAFSIPLAASAQTVWDTWDDVTPPWTITSSDGQAVKTQCETYGGCGNVCPSVSPNQGRITCEGCISGESVTVKYTLPVPVSSSSVTYLVLDVFSCQVDRQIGIQLHDSGANVWPSAPSAAACKGGTVVAGGVTVGSVLMNQWDTLYLTIPQVNGLADIASVDFVFFSGELEDGSATYFDNLRVMLSNPCLPTPTFTPTDTPTNTPCVDGMGYTCTPTFTFTPSCWFDTQTPCFPTFTPTHTPTPTATPTPTPWPIMVFPNPMEFGKADPDDNYCAQYQPAIKSDAGCVKFIGIPRGSTVKIFTVALAKVREFAPADINFPVPLPGSGMNADIGWIAWNGDNEDLNPVSAGLYFFMVEPPAGEKFIGKLAISRARKVK